MFSPDGTKICYCGEDLSLFGNQGTESLYILDFDAGVFTAATSPLATEEKTPQSLPTTVSYPNPFNSKTTIFFTLPETGLTEVDIYNVSGQRIRRLVDGQFSAGSHSVEWDGLDNHARPVSTGIYATRVKSGKTLSQKE